MHTVHPGYPCRAWLHLVNLLSSCFTGIVVVAEPVQVFDHRPPRLGQSLEVAKGNTELLARLPHDRRDVRVEVVVHGGEHVVLDLVVEASAHKVPPHTAACPVRGACGASASEELK